MTDKQPGRQCMLYVKGLGDGKSYRCGECGSNVFTRIEGKLPREYRCNGCATEYIEAAGTA